MFGVAIVPSMVFGVGMWFLPESPRWLVKRGQREGARAVLMRMRGMSDVGQELAEIDKGLARSETHGRWSDLLGPSIRPTCLPFIASMSTSSGAGPARAATSRGSRAIPQIGQRPGPSCRICGCIGQV